MKPRLIHCTGLLLAVACSGVPSASIVPEDLRLATTQPGGVRIEAEGSGRQLGVGPRVITSANLEQALEDTLTLAGVFSEVLEEGEGEWLLKVDVSEIESSDWSLEMYGDAVLVWRLMRGETGELVAQREIKTRGRARTEDTRDVEQRGKIAMQKALRENLTEGTHWLAGLELTLEPRPR